MPQTRSHDTHTHTHTHSLSLTHTLTDTHTHTHTHTHTLTNQDVAFADSRIRGETIAAEDVLHDMGAISIISSDR